MLSVQFSSVAQSCLTLCNPMNRSTSGLPPIWWQILSLAKRAILNLFLKLKTDSIKETDHDLERCFYIETDFQSNSGCLNLPHTRVTSLYLYHPLLPSALNRS